MCFKYNKLGHYKTNCLKLKKKSNKSKTKKAIVVIWSNSESLGSGEEKKSNKVVNLCLMAFKSEELSQAKMKELGSETNSLKKLTQEVQSFDFISDNDLSIAFDALYIKFKKLFKKYKKLKKELKFVKLENDKLFNAKVELFSLELHKLNSMI